MKDRPPALRDRSAAERPPAVSVVPIDEVAVAAYRIPTETPESDGTFTWNSNTLVLVELGGGGQRGLGYTYGGPSVATFIRERLAGAVQGRNALDIPQAAVALGQAVRNLGRPGVASMAIAAVDSALWDLKSRLLEVSLAGLLGAARPRVPIYASGGFTSYSTERLLEQLHAWIGEGVRRVKMKVGRDPDADAARVRAAREAVGSHVELYGLRLLRDRGPAGMEIAAGEYGYDLPYFRRMLAAEAVDVLQADATRCGGPTGFLQAAALCQAYGLPLSSHTAPMLHLPLCCASPPVVHLEYFHDHVRTERLLFDGVVDPVEGELAPDLSRPGLGLELKRKDAERFLVGDR